MKILGTYTANYTPTIKGLYDMFVGVNGYQIQGSPFSIFVGAGINFFICNWINKKR